MQENKENQDIEETQIIPKEDQSTPIDTQSEPSKKQLQEADRKYDIPQVNDEDNKTNDVGEDREIPAISANDEQTSESDNHSETAASMNDEITKITAFISKLENELNLRNERDKYKDEAIQRMTKQIETYEKGMIKEIKEPLIRDIILLYDSLEKFKKRFLKLENEDLNNEIDLLKDEVEEILYANSIEKIDLAAKEKYNREYHKVKDKVTSNNKEEHLTVKEILRHGFLKEGDVIRKQEIIVIEHLEIETEENE